MTIYPSIRRLALVALAAVMMATAASAAHARPDPDSGPGTWSATTDPAGRTAKDRPTGPTEHASLQPQGSATASSVGRATTSRPSVAAVAVPPAQGGFDWLSAGIGAAGMATVLTLAGGVVVARRRRAAVRSVTATLATLALALGLAGIASPAKPIRFAVPQPTFVGDCGSFEALIELEGMEWRTLFLDADGDVTRVLFTYPGGAATVTSLDSGASVSFSLTGPLHIDVTPDGAAYRFVGRWLFLSNPVTGEPGGVFLASGQLSLTEDENGISDWSWRGHSADVCAMLTE